MRQCLLDAASFQMSLALRRLFVTILVFCQPNIIRSLWDEFHPSMMQDYLSSSTGSNVVLINHVLRDMELLLAQHGKTLSDYELPELSSHSEDQNSIPRIIQDELSITIAADDINASSNLNSEQSHAFHSVKSALDRDEHAIFFIDGPGGTGKTYLYRAILASLRSAGHIALAVATSGIAATILCRGRTTHSWFKIPLDPDAASICSVSKQSELADLLKLSKAILWDEAPMANRYAFEALDRTLRDIMEVNLPFGGKVMILGGDFR